MTRSIRVLTICMLCLALPAVAHAATPFTAGTGSSPTVAVGSDGDGHVVWQTGGENSKVGYCRLSPGATSCNVEKELPFGSSTGAQSAGRAQVFAPAPEKVVIVAGCFVCEGSSGEERVYRWISTNDGESFSVVPQLIGKEQGKDGFGIWLDTPEIFVAAVGSRVKALNHETGGFGVQFAGTSTSYNPEVAQVEGTSKLVAATNDLGAVEYGVYEGGYPLSEANINSQAHWDSDLTLSSPEGHTSQTALDSGPSGVFLSYLHFVPNNSQIGLRRFDPLTNTFSGPTYVEGSDPIDDQIDFSEPDSFQDPSGRIHVVWDSQYEGGRLRYTVSDTSGNNFSTPATLAANEGFFGSEIAAGADGHGFATWTNPGGSVRIVPLDPYPESAPSSPPASTPPAAPAAAPTVTNARIGDRTLVPGQKTVFRFRSSSAGRAVLTFEKRFRGLKGRRKGKRVCLARTRRRLRALRRKVHSRRAFRKLLRRRSCRGFRRIGRIRQRVVDGANAIRFNGRIAGRKLSPGRYRAKLVVVDRAGRVSRTETLKFRVVRKVGRKKRRRRAPGA